MKKSSGFTLLEMLVVISIIGILMAIGAVSFSTAQQKGRDAKRRGDVKAMQNGFEQYYANNSGAYGTCSEMESDNTIFPGGAPTDPKTGASYSCNDLTAGYCLCAELDDDNAGNDDGDGACQFDGTTHYCVRNLQ